jgi:potassium-transporting ATPase KdpC subunit
MHELRDSTVHHHGPVLRGLIRPALASSVLFMLVTGLAYPLATTGVAQLLFHNEAQGSLIVRNGLTIGSAVIGQNFTRPEYLQPRPSATVTADPADSSKTIDAPYNAALSGASNLGPTSKKLIDQVSERVQAYRTANGLAADTRVPVDAVTASASGLDPEISLANARLQAKRIATARGLPEATVVELIDRETSPRQLGLLGDPRVNVLQVNIALDALVAKHSAAN